MDVINHQQAEREAQRVQANREELVERIARAVRQDGSAQPLKGLHFNRLSVPRGPVHGVTEPAFCVIAQGSKEVLLGDSRYRYDPMHYLLATVGLPSVSQVMEASQERPYLSLRLELPPTLVGSVMMETGHAAPPGHVDVDLWISTDAPNAAAVYDALREFGAPLSGLTEADFAEEGYFYQMGVPPVRVDILMGIPGLQFGDAWERRVTVEFDGLSVAFIARQDLIASKLASDRPQDLLDVKLLSQADDN